MDIDFVVIIPCYKRFDALFDLVASVPDKPNIAVLVVDDASPAEDFEAFKQRVAHRTNVKVFRNAKNSGAGYSRNFGLRYARENITGGGKTWIIFADDDDVFTQDAFDIFEQHKDSPADLIYFLADFCDLREKKDGYWQWYFGVKRYAMREFLSTGNSKMLRVKGGEPWAKMFSKAFLEREGMSFPEVKSAEDLVFVVDAGLRAGTIEAFEQKVYLYNVRDNSNCRTRNLGIELVRFNESCALNNVIISHKGYLLYQHDCFRIFCKLLARYGLKNAKPIFAVLKKNGLHLVFYCLLLWAYKLVTFPPRRIARRIKQARWQL